MSGWWIDGSEVRMELVRQSREIAPLSQERDEILSLCDELQRAVEQIEQLRGEVRRWKHKYEMADTEW